MAYFPFFVDIERKKCIIIGGGAVACRKVEVLLEYGPEITVVSPVMSECMMRLAEKQALAAETGSKGRLWLRVREYQEGDLETADFVVAATADDALNHQISERCRARRIPVNVVDVREECSFIFPALIKDDDITVGISTGGSSPTIAQYLKRSFKEALPEGFGALAKQLGSYRELVKERVDSLPVRTSIFKEMVSLGVRQGCEFSREDAERLIEKRFEEDRQLNEIRQKRTEK